MYKHSPKSPLMKALIGKQKNLPQALKAQIQAAPGSPAKAMDGPGIPKEAGKTGTAGANSARGKDAYDGRAPRTNAQTPTGPPKPKQGPKAGGKASSFNDSRSSFLKPELKAYYKNFGMGLDPNSDLARDIMQDTGINTGYKGKFKPVKPAKPAKTKPAWDKELNSLVSQRKGLKKGTAEYNKVQNSINEKLGSKVRRRVVETTKVPTKKATVSVNVPKPDIVRPSTNTEPAAKKPAVAKKPAAKKTAGQKLKGTVRKARLAQLDRKADRQEARSTRKTARKTAKADKLREKADKLSSPAKKASPAKNYKKGYYGK